MLNFNPRNVQEMKEAVIYVIDDLEDIYSRSNPPDILVKGKKEWLFEQMVQKKELFDKAKLYLGVKRIQFLKDLFSEPYFSVRRIEDV